MLRMRPGPNLFFLTCNAAQNSLFQICCHYFVSPLFLSKGVVQVDDTGIYWLNGNSKANFQCYSYLATIITRTLEKGAGRLKTIYYPIQLYQTFMPSCVPP